MKDRLKMVRDQITDEDGRKLSQTKFADVMHVTRDVIANYEAGRVEPTNLFISTLCDKYNINETWLRSGEGEMFAPMDRNQEIASITAQLFKADESDFRYQLTKILYDMDEDQIELLKEIVYKLRDGLI